MIAVDCCCQNVVSDWLLRACGLAIIARRKREKERRKKGEVDRWGEREGEREGGKEENMSRR